jgi:hypothetical protein
VLKTSQRQAVTLDGPPTPQQTVDLINADETLLCRPRAISRRLEERTRSADARAKDNGPGSVGWISWAGLGMREAEDLLDWLANHPGRQWEVQLGPGERFTVRWR